MTLIDLQFVTSVCRNVGYRKLTIIFERRLKKLFELVQLVLDSILWRSFLIFFELLKLPFSCVIISEIEFFKEADCAVDGCSHIKETLLTVFMEKTNLLLGFLLLFIHPLSLLVEVRQGFRKFLAVRVEHLVIVFIHGIPDGCYHFLLGLLELPLYLLSDLYLGWGHLLLRL